MKAIIKTRIWAPAEIRWISHLEVMALWDIAFVQLPYNYEHMWGFNPVTSGASQFNLKLGYFYFDSDHDMLTIKIIKNILVAC